MEYVLVLLVLLYLCGGTISQQQFQNEKCIYRVDTHHDVYNLNPLADHSRALTFEHSGDGSVYEATFCDSIRLMRPHCPVADAVAAKSGHCEYFGRSSSLESVSFMNDTDPNHGVVITYGNGGTCQGHAELTNRVTFVVACDRYERESVVFTNVHYRPASCEYVYYFRSPYGCPYPESITTEEGPVYTFFVILLLVVLYCSMGYCYNMKYRGASGVEALPHINIVRKSYKSASAYCSKCCQGDNYSRSGGPISDIFTGVYVAGTVIVEDTCAFLQSTFMGASPSSPSSAPSSGDRYASLLGNMTEHGSGAVTGPNIDDNEEISITLNDSNL